MTDLIEGIGPLLGVAAFLGLSILAFLTFQQAREVRRLREWAGRAPERAAEASEATAAAAEARGDEPAAPEEPAEEPRRGGAMLDGVRERLAPAYEELDRRSPVDPRYLLILIAAMIVAAAVLTGGFGLFGDDEGGGGKGGGGQKAEKPDEVEVAVLNATQEESESGVVIAGVQGLADEVAKEVVKPAGFAIGEKANANSGFTDSVVMFEEGEQGAAEELAAAVADQLGETDVRPIEPDVASLSGGAPLVLVVGQDDAEALGSPTG